MAPKRARVSTICSLPDDAICHILSFLSTEESVRTRVLSPRWRNLFSLVPVLDFEFDYPSTNSTPNPNSTLDPTSIIKILNRLLPISAHTSSVPAHRVKRFLDFVKWVFNSYRANSMNKFSFKSKRQFKATSQLLSWISKSVLLGVRELDISMFFKVPKMLPRAVFNCETLTDLKLSGNFVLDVPNGACLPCVKNIWLFHLYFTDSYSAWRLFRSCPVLENLFMNLTHTGDIQVLDVSIPSLKKLTVAQSPRDNYVLVLNVPNLEDLDYTGYFPHGVYANHQGLKSLNKAFIGFPAHTHDMYDPLEKIFSVICHVPVLRICTWTLEALKRSGRSLPIFHNLTRLEIKVVSIASFDTGFMIHLLFAMPNLEVLVVDNDPIDNEHGHLFPEDVPPCVSLCLKEVRFIGFFMMDYELKLAEYILKNAEVLDTLKIESHCSVETRFLISVELLAFPRYSRRCQIVLT